MQTIFTVTNPDLERLSPEQAVDIFRELLWAEAATLGIGKNLINVPSAITVADGGIDAEVKNAEANGGQGIIKKGLTRYQIKTGEFSLRGESNIKRILLKDTAAELKPRVKSCLDKNGTLVVILFGWDDPETKDDQIIGKFKQVLKKYDEKYNDAEIEVWRQNNLISFLQPFPSLCLKVNGRNEARFRTFAGWSRDAEMSGDFESGPTQGNLISDIQTELRKDEKEIHIRIWGEPGIGKTRLVLETLRGEDIQPLVIYCENAGVLIGSELMNELLTDNNSFNSILVIDECDPESRARIWNKLRYYSPRIKLISVYNEFDDTTGDLKYFNTPPLNGEQISKIIESYGISKDQANTWSELCGGSPRYAHVIGKNLAENPEDMLKTPATVDIWERSIAGLDDRNDARVQQRRMVLQYIGLFKRFGYGRPLTSEAKIIAEIVKEADPQITWPRFQQIIEDLRNRRILQGEHTLYITPKALHIKVWAEWWDTYGDSFDLDDFSERLSAKLLDWFYEMFEYAAESDVASAIVKELLGEKGPFRDDKRLRTQLGARFFLALTKADPVSAGKCLRRIFGTWDKDKLLSFTTGRREVIWSLELIAKRRELFSDAAKLLLMLGEAENETWSNNASGVFAALFSPAPGQVAPTGASPKERFPVLKEALESDSKERRVLAIRACNAALESEHFIRMIGNQPQGLRQEPELWMPKTYGEIFDAYRRVWNLLRKRLDSLHEDEQKEAVSTLLRHVRGLGKRGNLVDMLIDTVDELSEKKYVDNREILACVLQVIQYEGPALPPEVLVRWEQVRDSLTGTDFRSLLRRYVGMSIWEAYDREGREDQVQQQIHELALQAHKDKGLLGAELGWLMTEDAKEGYRFGYELGKTDKDFSLLPELMEAQRIQTQNANTSFFGGYLRTLFEGDADEWEKQLDAVANDKDLKMWLPELTWRSGTSDKSSLRVLDFAQKGIIDVTQYRSPIYGGIGISENVFQKWIRFLLDHPHSFAAYIALDWYHFFYIRTDSDHTLPEKVTPQLLLHPSFICKQAGRRRGQLDDYHWTQITMKYIELYPGRDLGIAEKMLEHFGEEGTIFEDYHSQTNAVLNEIAKRHPNEVWEKITEYLGPPIDSRAFRIKGWLHGSSLGDAKNKDTLREMLSVFPLEKVWAWVDEDKEKRAWYVASFVPKKLFRKEGEICLAREVLIKYGDREDVRSELMSNFFTGISWGSISENLLQTEGQMLRFKEQEDNENVKKWIDEYIELLDQDINRWKIEEERQH